ncbi:MAG: hypothetical protein DMD78_28945 [Candidatus Rokuibacteriota bacterium]|nr:MAG: hypothetical protein DMD78_28945 [Candidatus Rokubacteria bacterium]
MAARFARLAAATAVTLLAAACSTYTRIGETTLPAAETAVLVMPNYVNVVSVDGKSIPANASTLCNGPLCGPGIELVLTPGQHEVEVKYHDSVAYSVGTTKLTQRFEQGRRYTLVVDRRGGRIYYRITAQ